MNDYLRRLTIAVAPIPQTRRVQIIKDIASLVYETRSTLPVQSPAAVLDILDRVGRPEDLARRAPGDQRAVIESRRRRWLLVIGLVMIGLGMLGCLAAVLLGSSPGSGPPLRHGSVARVAPTRVTPENILVKAAGEASQTRWEFQHHARSRATSKVCNLLPKARAALPGVLQNCPVALNPRAKGT